MSRHRGRHAGARPGKPLLLPKRNARPMSNAPGPSSINRETPWTAIFIAGLGTLLLVRLAALYWNATDLFFDEAQYWSWSEEPAVGVFSKPPLLARVTPAAPAAPAPG